MTTTPEHDAKFAKIIFAKVYPHYVSKIVKKGRTIEELHQVISWLTGYDESQIQEQIAKNSTFEEFFAGASLNPNAHLITGTICGYKVEKITTPLTKKARYLDKLIDELAKGKPIEKIQRQ